MIHAPVTLRELENGRYTLHGLLGEGGMGAVYLARDERLKVWRAVKVLAKRDGMNRFARNRFEAEAAALAKIDHPNVIRVHDVVDGNPTFIVMELADGGSPAEWLARNGPMSARMACDVILQVAEGLSAAHKVGVIHRDVKPENILVTSDNVCKIADFGIAFVEHAVNRQTVTGAMIGTPTYMSPEQRRDSKHLDPRTDIYSLAATLHTLLTDRLDGDLFAYDAIPEVLDGVSAELQPLLKRAINYRPDDRYPTMEHFISALRAVLPTLPAVPSDSPPLVIRSDPRAGNTQQAGVIPTVPSRPNVGLLRKRTVLVIDDDPMMVRLATFVLKNLQYGVLSAHDGQEAMRVVDAFDGYLDVVLTDVVMPGEPGTQVARALRRARPGVRIVFMSSHERAALQQRGLDPGGEFLHKPFTMDELAQAVQVAMTHSAEMSP